MSLSSRAVVARGATMLFNFVQLGLAVEIATPGGAVGSEVFLLLAFEIGILIDSLWRAGSIRLWSVVLAVSAVVLFASELLPGGMWRTGTLAATVCLVALALKKIRTATDAMGDVKKRWRAAGYLLAGAFSLEIAAIGALLLALVLARSSVAAQRDTPLLSPFRLEKENLWAYAAIMLHHLHYFSYAYLIVFWLIEDVGMSILLIGPAFYIGWLGYYTFERATRHHKAIVVGGHVLASAAVAGLAFATRTEPFLVLWFLTGLGGGTIILLRNLVTGMDREVYERFKTWEAFGHVAGLGVLVVATLMQVSDLAYGVAALAGMGCAVCVLVVGQAETRSTARQ